MLVLFILGCHASSADKALCGMTRFSVLFGVFPLSFHYREPIAPVSKHVRTTTVPDALLCCCEHHRSQLLLGSAGDADIGVRSDAYFRLKKQCNFRTKISFGIETLRKNVISFAWTRGIELKHVKLEHPRSSTGGAMSVLAATVKISNTVGACAPV